MHIIFAIARVLLVLIFLLSGAMKLLDIPGTAAQIEPVVAIPDLLQDFVAQVETATSMKWPQLLAILAGVIEVVAGLLIAFNIGTRGAAAVLALFTLVATFYFHAFWNMSGDAHADQHDPCPEESLHHRRTFDHGGARPVAAAAAQRALGKVDVGFQGKGRPCGRP